MADATTVVEGKIKFREGKKWKPRWCVLKKPSPVADRLQALLYKDLTEYAKNEAKPKLVFALDAFFGLDAGFMYDREPHVLAIICHKSTSLMAFELRENMIQFEIKIRQSMGEEHQFPVKVVKAPSSSRLPKDPVRLMIHDMRFCLIAQIPPKIFLSWNIEDLRRFGAREGKFCFEGGTRCGKGSGIFALQSEQAEDIENIVNLASTGKMANCHRKFKNRSSQIDFNSHIIADMSSSPSSLSIHHPNHPDIANRAPPQGALPVTLNCCHDNQTGSAESEDWSWYKRHSVSVMDHHRIAALREEGFLDSREQFVMGIYDVPPNHGRRLDDNSWESPGEPSYAHPRPDPESGQTATLSNTSSCSTPVCSSTMLSCRDYGNYKRIVPREREYMNSGSDEQRQANVYKRQSASAELLDTKVSSLDEMMARNEQRDSHYKSSHEESLQRLKKQESDLQREMVLLDEILQNCSPKNADLSFGESYSETDVAVKRFEESTLKQGSKQAPNQSLMASLDHNFPILSGNISFLRLSRADLPPNTNLKKLDRATVLRLNTSMPEGTPGSPMFHAKLCNIPPNSRLNAPLPYVNLSKYDDESNSHVHLPGSADSVPVSRISSMQVLPDWNHGLRVRNLSLASLHNPPAASSLINISQSVPGRNQFFEHRPTEGSHFTAGTALEVSQWPNGNMTDRDEILVVNMDTQSEYSDQNVHAPPHSLLQNDGGTAPKGSSDIVKILTTDSRRPVREERRFNVADIYENLPFKKSNTPPPELPPKGPDLLKKLKAAASNSSQFSGPQNASRINHPNNPEKNVETRNYGYDNHPLRVAHEKELQKSTDTKEDNYLIMGSPKIKHKELPAQSQVALHPSVSPHRSHCENSDAAKGDYLGMGAFVADGINCCNDDEIYLDVDTSQQSHQRDLYISEADLKLPPATNMNVLGESTYMEMANVTSKKTLVAKNVETTEGAYSAGPPVTPTPPPPPRPVSLKVRHNSDSGISPRSGESIATDDRKNQKPKAKPIKSPTKVYTKIKKMNQQGQVPEAPMPFPNLIEFSKKMSDNRSTYVNTYVDAEKNLVPQEVFINRDVPLPEPIKEGFLARFKRRSSRDKSASQAQEKPANSKNRNSVLERSISEHDSTKAAKEEKSSRLKVGRRRSSSFPNQLSYQEFLDSSGTSIIKQTASSSSSFSSGSSRPKPDQSESSSSVRDFSDDSDMSPLLKRGDKRIDPQTLTVLHVQRSDQSPINPYLSTYKSSAKSNHMPAESSKTDDEKLIEIIQRKGQPKKAAVYQRSSSLDLKKSNQEPEQEYFKLPQIQPRKDRRFSFDKLIGCSSSFDSDIPCSQEPATSLDNVHNSFSDHAKVSSTSSSSFSLDLEHTPPSLPPKTRPYQGPLSPVIETAPLLPTLAEPIYVEMDEFLSSSDVERARKEKDKVRTTLHIQPAVFEDEDGSNRISDVKTQAGRLSQPVSSEVVNRVSYTTLVVPVDITQAEQYPDTAEATSSNIAPLTCSVCQSTSYFNDIGECTNPAKTVLRPRSGQEYVVIRRKSVASPNSFSGLSSHSPLLSSVFNFEHLKPSEASSHRHHSLNPLCGHPSISHLPSSAVQQSPSISSPTETIRSSSSLYCHSWEPDPNRCHHGHKGQLHVRTVADISSPSSSPRPVFSHNSAASGSSIQQRSAPAVETGETMFFPMDMSFNTSAPSSPFSRQHAAVTPTPHTPIYVNQEFVDKQHTTSSSSQTVSTASSHSSASPIRAGVYSLISLICKDSSKHHSPSDSNIRGTSFRIGRIRSRRSESDSHKADKHSFSPPTTKQPQSSTSSSTSRRCHSDSRSDTAEALQLTLPPDIHISIHSKIHQKEYDKFADSSIISRRRRTCTEGKHSQNAETAVINGSTESSLRETGPQNLPLLKSSGYKNIDCINAATVAAASTPSPRSLSSGPDASNVGHTSQLENIMESQITPDETLPSPNRSSVFIETNNLSTSYIFSGIKSVNLGSSAPHSTSPLPPLPRNNQLSSSPISSCSLNSIISSDTSDSPPSYFAPSPPGTPPPPALPPRISLLALPSSVPTSTPHEPETSSDSSVEEQELNYIEIDMTSTKTTSVPPPPPLGYSRRNKRARQQKEKDYAKLRYAVIDHRATRALQRTRQEHEQCRDSSRRHAPPKDLNLGNIAVHLSRINSAPASSKRKQLSLVQRERKLSSGSTESC